MDSLRIKQHFVASNDELQAIMKIISDGFIDRGTPLGNPNKMRSYFERSRLQMGSVAGCGDESVDGAWCVGGPVSKDGDFLVGHLVWVCVCVCV